VTVPTLIIQIELEQPGRITLVADCLEDELRLRSWLRRSTAFRRLSVLLEQLLDDLDDGDRIAA